MMNVNKNLFVLVFLIASSFFVSCIKEGVVFDETQDTGTEWLKEDVKSFTYTNTDTVSYYNMFLTTRANKDYPYSNLFVIVKTFHPDGKAIADTLQYSMADATGKMLGNGITDLKESELWFKTKYRFKQEGTYKFTLQQAVRKSDSPTGDSALKGVHSVGFRIEKAQ